MYDSVLGKGTESLDVIAHEYTHIITRKYAKWSSGNRETGDDKRRNSDILGKFLQKLSEMELTWRWETESIHNPYENG